MPQDFIDAINSAVRQVNPSAGEMITGSFTLGSDFDEWFGPEAMMKYGLGPFPPEFIASFEAKFAEKRDEIKASLVASAVDVEKRRMARDLGDSIPATTREPMDVRAWLAEQTGHGVTARKS